MNVQNNISNMGLSSEEKEVPMTAPTSCRITWRSSTIRVVVASRRSVEFPWCPRLTWNRCRIQWASKRKGRFDEWMKPWETYRCRVHHQSLYPFRIHPKSPSYPSPLTIHHVYKGSAVDSRDGWAKRHKLAAWNRSWSRRAASDNSST